MADHFAAGRVADFEGGPVAGRYPLAIYEEFLSKQPGRPKLRHVPRDERDERLGLVPSSWPRYYVRRCS